MRSVAGAVEELQIADSEVALEWNCKVMLSLHATPNSGLQQSTQLTAQYHIPIGSSTAGTYILQQPVISAQPFNQVLGATRLLQVNELLDPI